MSSCGAVEAEVEGRQDKVKAMNGKATTIRDVARLSGVSVGTVSRSLNAPDTVRPDTLGKVRAAIKSLHFQPDARAQTMRRRTTMTVGFVIDDIANPWHASCFKAIDNEMRAQGYSLYVMSTNGRAGDEAAAIDMMQHGRADGLILDAQQRAGFRARSRGSRHCAFRPCCSTANYRSRSTPFSLTMRPACVRRPAICLASDIAVSPLSRPASTFVRAASACGFVEAFQRSGLEPPQDLIRSQSLSVDFGFREASSLLQMRKRPSAIIAAGNRILVGVLRAIQQQNVAIPRDLSLIACDRSDVALLYPGPITLIDRRSRKSDAPPPNFFSSVLPGKAIARRSEFFCRHS